MVIGNLGKDCIVNQVNGKSVINFSVAHTEKFKDHTGTQKEKTTWVECGYWTDKTGIAPYLKKGQQVYVEGQPEVRTWEKDGKSVASLQVRVFGIQLLGSKNGDKQEQPAAQGSNVGQHDSVDDNTGEDLPF